MPQMAPMSWLTLFILFFLFFIMFNILNFYCFFSNNFNLNHNKLPSLFKNNTLNWKW